MRNLYFFLLAGVLGAIAFPSEHQFAYSASINPTGYFSPYTGHFDYWTRCADDHYDLERRISYCKSILSDGRHSQLEVLTEIGNAYFAARKYNDALANYRDALRYDDSPCVPQGRCYGLRANEGLEESLVLSGQFDPAMDHVNARIKNDAYPAEPYDQRCWLRAIAGKDLDLALADCNQALKIDARDATALDSRGLVNFKLNKLTEALADYDAALDRDSHLAGAWYVRGIIKLRNGNADAGNDDIETSKKRDSTVAERYADYGVTP